MTEELTPTQRFHNLTDVERKSAIAAANAMRDAKLFLLSAREARYNLSPNDPKKVAAAVEDVCNGARHTLKVVATRYKYDSWRQLQALALHYGDCGE